jgi:hypothetical protein
MTLMSGDGGGEAPGVLTLPCTPTEAESDGVVPARPPELSVGGGVAASVVIAMIAAAVYQQGGFYPTDAFGLAIVSAVVVVAVLRRVRDRASVRVAVAVGALTVWWLLRSIAAHRAIAFFPLGASFLGFLAGFLAVRRLGDRERTRVVMALVSLGAATALLGLAGVLWHVTSWAQSAGGFGGPCGSPCASCWRPSSQPRAIGPSSPSSPAHCSCRVGVGCRRDGRC